MNLHLAWASETGHAIDLTRQFSDQCRQRNINITSAQSLTETTTFIHGVWVMFVSTTGQGAPPYSMRSLWKEMMKKGYKVSEQVTFAIYSLGDRSYGDNFGLAARKLRQRLKMLGATELLEIGLGDDQEAQGYRETYLSGWSQQLLSLLKPIVKQGASPDLFVDIRHFPSQCEVQVKQITEVASRKGRKVVWLELQVHGREVNEGDVLEIFPHNRKEEVEFMLNHLQLPPNHPLTFLGQPTTLEQVLTEQVNISSVLNYYFFSNIHHQQLISSAATDLHRDKLLQFCTDYDQFYNYIIRYKRNLAQFLKDFDLKLDPDYLLKTIGHITPRKYSVAKVKHNTAWILVKIVQTKITEGRMYKGLCSHDLLTRNIKRKANLLRGDITPQEYRKHNLIVTLGTGIAPFLWTIDKLNSEQQQHLLVYTNSHSDQIFHRTLCHYPKDKLTEIVSCTREGGTKLIPLIRDHAEQIASFLKAGTARVFYCGPKQIQQFLTRFLSDLLQLSLQDLQKNKLIVYQNW